MLGQVAVWLAPVGMEYLCLMLMAQACQCLEWAVCLPESADGGCIYTLSHRL